MADNPPSFENVTLFDRPRLTVDNLLSGNPSAAVRAFLAPDSLSPEERTDWATKNFGSRGLIGTLAGMVTNPFVIGGLVLSSLYPIAPATQLLKYAKGLGGYDRRWGFLTSHAQSLHELFRGTPLPKIFDKLLWSVDDFKGRYSAEFSNLIERFQEVSGRKFDFHTQVRVSAALDGLDDAVHPAWEKIGIAGGAMKPLNLDKAERSFVDESRKLYQRMFKEVVPNEAAEKALIEKLSKQGIEVDNIEELSRKYFPHMIPRTTRDLDEFARQIVESTGGNVQSFRAITEAATGGVASKALAKRFNIMTPAYNDLRHVPELFKPGALQKIQAFEEGQKAKYGLELEKFQSGARPTQPAPIRHYAVTFMPTTRSYIHGMGQTFGWTTRGFGDDLMKEVRTVQKVAPEKVHVLRDTYVPIALGRLTLPQSMMALEWSGLRSSMVDTLNKPWAQQALGSYGNRLKEMILNDHGGLTWRNVGGSIASYFYTTTLGLNPASAFNNMLQTVLTTIPTIGPEATIQGMKRAVRRGERYFSLRTQGISAEKAFDRVFPDAEFMGLGGVGKYDRPLRDSLDAAWRTSSIKIPGAVSSGVERGKRALMSIFTTSERFNRITAFEGTKWKALREGATELEAIEVASEITEATQFLSGPGHTPRAIVNLWAPLRQFMQFQLRYLNFLFGPGTTFGSGAQPGRFGGRNFGTLGRGLAGSGLAFEAGRGLLDTDFSRSLVFGAIPNLGEFGPFGITPFVPPFAQAIGAVGQSLVEQDPEQLQRSAALFVPGGVALSRGVGFLPVAGSDRAARFFKRSFADYDNPTPEGRIPVHSSEGALEGFFTPMQILMRGLGLPESDSQREKELAGFILSQRDRIRGMRREFVEASLANDTGRALRVREAWQKAYPEFGDLILKKSDVRAVHLRRDIPRIERLLETLPEETRGPLTEVVATALANEAAPLLGLNTTEALNFATIREREGFRVRPPTIDETAMQGVNVPSPGQGVGNLSRARLEPATAQSAF